MVNKKVMVFGLATVFFICQTKAQTNEDNQERQHRKPPSIEQLFKDLDANKDGKLSVKEVKGPLKNHFDKVDLNEDGFLTKEELEKAPKPRRRKKVDNN